MYIILHFLKVLQCKKRLPQLLVIALNVQLQSKLNGLFNLRHNLCSEVLLFLFDAFTQLETGECQNFSACSF